MSTIFYIGNEYSKDNRTSSHHIASRLHAEHELVYFEASGLRMPRVHLSDIYKIFSRIKHLFTPKKANEQDSGLAIVSLFLIPFAPKSLLNTINKKLAIRAIKRAATAQGLTERPIVWCTVPTLAEFIDDLEPIAVVYYCVDDFTALPGVNIEHIQYLDDKLSRRAEVIFTPSMPMFKIKSERYNNAVLSPHGVDAEHFGQAMENHSRPPEFAKIENPIIGFFGLIEHWIDIELVCHLARNLPQATIIMIGRVAVDIQQFDLPKNIMFLGAKPYKDLPSFASFFDIAIIPYVLNQQVFNSNPLKLREYLATGKPIVSVSCPEIDKFSELVEIADGYDDFVDKTKKLLTTSDEFSTQRIAAVKNDTWEARVQTIWQHVDDKLKQGAKN